jgi:hypothetical protein
MKPIQTSVLSVILMLTMSGTGWCFYNPAMGRWVNRDPLGERGGLNLVAFVRNSPQTSVDPRGEGIYNIAEHARVVSEAGGNCCSFSVKLKCRKTEPGWWSAYTPDALHCYLEVRDDDINDIGTVNAGPYQGSGILGGLFVRRTTRFYPDGDVGKGGAEVALALGPQCEFIACILRRAESFSDAHPYWPPGGETSNTFIGRVIGACGGSADFPNGSYGVNPETPAVPAGDPVDLWN